MSLLGRDDLEKALSAPDLDKRLIVTPMLSRAQVGRGAVDLRLGTEFLLLRRTHGSGLDPRNYTRQDIETTQERVTIPMGDELWLHPRHFVLAATLEFLALPDDLCAYVVGRSSWGRLGLIVATAVFVHPGFRGCLTLELVNEGDAPVCLCPGFRIAQLVVQRLESPAPKRAGDRRKYEAPVRPQAAQLRNEQTEFERLNSLGAALRSRLG